MISRPTVLILGAGACVDYGFPTGRDLLVGIWKRTAPGGELFRFLKERMKFFEDDIDNFRLALDRSNSPSVDLFLENRSEFERTGKLAIAASLIPRESYGTFSRVDHSQPRWYEYLFGLMTDRWPIRGEPAFCHHL